MNASESRALLEAAANVTLDNVRSLLDQVAAFWSDGAARVAAGIANEIFIEDQDSPLSNMRPQSAEVTRLGFERFLAVVAAHFAEMFKNNQGNRELVEASSGSVDAFVDRCMVAFHPFGEAVRRNIDEPDQRHDGAQYFMRLFDYAALGMWADDEVLLDSAVRCDASSDDRLFSIILCGMKPNYDLTHIKWFSAGLTETYKTFIAELELAWTDLAAVAPDTFSEAS